MLHLNFKYYTRFELIYQYDRYNNAILIQAIKKPREKRGLKSLKLNRLELVGVTEIELALIKF